MKEIEKTLFLQFKYFPLQKFTYFLNATLSFMFLLICYRYFSPGDLSGMSIFLKSERGKKIITQFFFTMQRRFQLSKRIQQYCMKQLANVAKRINPLNMHAEVMLYLKYTSYFFGKWW